jgi:MFS family permease
MIAGSIPSSAVSFGAAIPSTTYALAQIPGGLFLDRFGNKVTYFLSLTLWSLFTR